MSFFLFSVVMVYMLEFIFSIFKKNKGLKLPPEDELDYGEIYPDNDNDVPVKKSRGFIFDWFEFDLFVSPLMIKIQIVCKLLFI